MATDAKKKKKSRTSGKATTGSHKTAGGSRTSTGSARPKSGKKKMTRRERERRKRMKILLFVVEVFVIFIMLGVLWAVMKTEKVGKLDLAEEDIIINEEVQQQEKEEQEANENSEDGGSKYQTYRNIALFGVDSTKGSLTSDTRSDTIIIASVNMDTGDIKLCSVYRDTYLNRGNDTYNKCNSAYGMGGPVQAINMLNMNLDLNIRDFVAIGFVGLKDVIDALGGIEINVTEAEVVHINSYQSTMAENLGLKSFTEVTHAGLQTLNGLQATAYCRVRYTAGDDFKRAERQRNVLLKVMDKAKQASVSELTTIANNVFDKVYTSLDLSEIVELLGNITKYNVVGNDGFPQADMRKGGKIGGKGDCIIPFDLVDNVVWLHQFLFEDENYEPSETVKRISQDIEKETAKYVGSKN